MATLSPFLPLPCSLSLAKASCCPQSHSCCLPSSTLHTWSRFPLKKTQKPSRPRSRAVVVVVHGGRNNSGGPAPDGSQQFMDENGVVEDMDGYLNYLSLEYDSVWDTKPAWCQPWTITLTGVLIIGASWVILQSVAVTLVVLSLISAWWYIFLYSYPKAYSDMIAERRKKVTSGDEDTFGLKTSQLNEL